MEHANDEATAARYPFHRKNMEAPSIRLAHVPGAQGDNCLTGRDDRPKLPASSAPSLLVSFFYLPNWLKNRHRYIIRDWVMDSGAFSAHAQGTEINLADYIDTCKRLLDEDSSLIEIYALDVIGDWKASKRNTEKMWKAGVEAIPCFHGGEPWDALKGMAKDYPKIAIGGVARRKGNIKMNFAQQCFARVWPKKIHGFGYGTREAVLTLPFHSTDSTSWELGPCGFGNWVTFGKMQVRGSKQNLRVEVEYFLDLEKEARHRWRKEMAMLEADDHNGTKSKGSGDPVRRDGLKRSARGHESKKPKRRPAGAHD
jgi:hypothetical protein